MSSFTMNGHRKSAKSHSRPPTPPSPTPIQESVTNNVSFPALPSMAHSNSAGTGSSSAQSSHPQRAPRHSVQRQQRSSGKRSPPKPPPKRNLPNLDMKAVNNGDGAPRDLDPLQLSTINGGGPFLTTSPSMDSHIPDGSASPTSPHRMSVSEHRRLHRSTNSFSATIKLGHHQTSQSKKVSPYGEEPSLRDSKWLRDELKSRNTAGDFSAVLLQVEWSMISGLCLTECESVWLGVML